MLSRLRKTALSILILTAVMNSFGSSFGLPEKLLQLVRAEYGSIAEARLRTWQNLIEETTDSEDLNKLSLVNDFFNESEFVNDIDQWNKKDYWATPIEFLIHDAGDCEDFSIAKYFTLREMGVEASKLRITYVKSLSLNQAHMVLAYYPSPSAEPLILDNINKIIRPASERQDLQPVYSFNAQSLWVARSRNEQLQAGKSSQIGHWQDLVSRMEIALN